MTLFIISILAGVLTVLAPCILPLLPVVIGSADSNVKRKISKKSIRVIISLGISATLFTLLLKVSTVFIDIPNSFWQWFSGGILVLLGVTLLFPRLWAQSNFIQKGNLFSQKILGKGLRKKNIWGDVLMGFALGPIFTTCSPTYLFIIATVLPASFGVGFIYLLGFVLGMSISLLIIAYFGQVFINRFTRNQKKFSSAKKIFGAIIIVLGVSIILGLDKQLETKILDSGYGATINFEQNLIDRFSSEMNF